MKLDVNCIEAQLIVRRRMDHLLNVINKVNEQDDEVIMIDDIRSLYNLSWLLMEAAEAAGAKD